MAQVAAASSLSVAETKRLGSDLLASRAHVNNAPFLLAILSSDKESSETDPNPKAGSLHTQCRLEALRSLLAFFIPLLRSRKFVAAAKKKAGLDIAEGQSQNDGDGEPASHAEAVYRLWVWNKYREFTKTLFRVVSRPRNAHILQVAAINALMDLIREEKPGEFNNSLYLKLCARMVGSKGQSNEILQVLMAKYFKYSDVRYFTYGNMDKLVVKRLPRKERDMEVVSSDDDNKQEVATTSLHTFVRNVYDVISHVPPPSRDELKDGDSLGECWSNSFGEEECENTATGKDGSKKKNTEKSSATQDSLKAKKDRKKQKFIMSKAWVSFLQLPLPLDTYKKVLAQLHQSVIPFMTNPILLSDFLTQSYNIGGLISVMALSSLFILITKYGLEYPEFYNKLYALLEPSIFVAKYRSRFFELLDMCLRSSHLPGYLGAAFAKRLGRLVLSAPPSGAIVVIALIHNLLRRHPSINVLVHQPDSNVHGDGENGISRLGEGKGSQEEISDRRPGADPFVANEADTAKCNALKSSLWEIETLRRHYCPAVSRFMESLETDLTVRAKTSEVAIGDFSSTSYATIFGEEVGRRLKSVPLAFYSNIPTTLFPESNFDGSFDGWRFSDSPGPKSESLEENEGTLPEETRHLEEFSEEMEEGKEESLEDDQSDEVSSDGSRSRSEESDGEGWPQPRLKRIRDG